MWNLTLVVLKKFGKSKDDDRKSESYILFRYAFYKSLAFFYCISEEWVAERKCYEVPTVGAITSFSQKISNQPNTSPMPRQGDMSSWLRITSLEPRDFLDALPIALIFYSSSIQNEIELHVNPLLILII